jgi:hypothetical protein
MSGAPPWHKSCCAAAWIPPKLGPESRVHTRPTKPPVVSEVGRRFGLVLVPWSGRMKAVAPAAQRVSERCRQGLASPLVAICLTAAFSLVHLGACHLPDTPGASLGHRDPHNEERRYRSRGQRRRAGAHGRGRILVRTRIGSRGGQWGGGRRIEARSKSAAERPSEAMERSVPRRRTPGTQWVSGECSIDSK